MPWSFALPHVILTSPYLAVATPITAGTAVALLTNRKSTGDDYRLSLTTLQESKIVKPTSNSSNRPTVPQVGCSHQPGLSFMD